MTTTIKVTSHNYPARVEIYDNGTKMDAYTRILTPEDGEQQFHCTTTRELRITDLDYNDPEVVAAKEAKEKG